MKKLAIPKAIIFDLDGTIITSETIEEQAWQESCRAVIKDNKELDTQKLLSLINKSADIFWNDPINNAEGRKNILQARTRIVENALSQMGIVNRVLTEDIASIFSYTKDNLRKFVPNAEDVLKQLRERDIRLLLLTNGEAEMQREKIRRFKLDRYFTNYFIEGEMGYGKPDVRVYQTALDRTAVSANETWMIGNDLLYDLSGARELGILSVWCDYTGKGLPSDSQVVPDVIINDIKEILTLLNNK